MEDTRCLYDEEGAGRYKVSASQLQSLMACPRRWSYGYVEGLRPRVERPYLTIGKLCHLGMQAAMEARWSGVEDLDRIERSALLAMDLEWDRFVESVPLLDEEMGMQEDLRDDARAVFSQALRELDPLRWDVATVVRGGQEAPALELHFLIPCIPGTDVHGFIDAILIDRGSGQAWCTDYKFRRTLAPDDDEQYNLQNAIYLRACREMGVDVVGTMTWQHLNTPAATPALLKSGKVSRAKVKTTWERYAEFCLEHGEDPAEYREEMVPKLGEIEWWRATKEYRSDETVQRIWDGVVVPYSRMASTLRTGPCRRVGTERAMFPWNCRMCQFADLCQAELRGYDAEFLRATEYVCDR